MSSQLSDLSGENAETNPLPKASPVTKFSVATTKSWKENDEWKRKTQWHTVVAYGQAFARMAPRERKSIHPHQQSQGFSTRFPIRERDELVLRPDPCYILYGELFGLLVDDPCYRFMMNRAYLLARRASAQRTIEVQDERNSPPMPADPRRDQ
jgi:Single-strand binding protein family